MVPSLPPDTQCLSLSQSMPKTQSACPMNVCTGCSCKLLLRVLVLVCCMRHSTMSSAEVPPVTTKVPEGLTDRLCWPLCSPGAVASRSGPSLCTGGAGYATFCHVRVGMCSWRSALHLEPTSTLSWSSQTCSEEAMSPSTSKNATQHGAGSSNTLCLSLAAAPAQRAHHRCWLPQNKTAWYSLSKMPCQFPDRQMAGLLAPGTLPSAQRTPAECCPGPACMKQHIQHQYHTCNNGELQR